MFQEVLTQFTKGVIKMEYLVKILMWVVATGVFSMYVFVKKAQESKYNDIVDILAILTQKRGMFAVSIHKNSGRLSLERVESVLVDLQADGMVVSSLEGVKNSNSEHECWLSYEVTEMGEEFLNAVQVTRKVDMYV